MRTTQAIFKKQTKDMIKNKEIFLQFLMFPIIALILSRIVPTAYGDDGAVFSTAIFSAMFSCMVIIQVTTMVIAEHKEKNNLRFLMMAGVKPREYIFGIGGAILISALAVAGFFAFIEGHSGQVLVEYLGFFLLNVIVSVLIGGTLGMFSRNVQASTAIAVPVGALLGFLPMIAAFNETIRNVARWTYIMQFTEISVQNFQVDLLEPLLITLGNIVVFAIIFAVVYRKKGLRA